MTDAVAWFVALSALAIGVAPGIGVAGYHFFGGLPWIDALLNASAHRAPVGSISRAVGFAVDSPAEGRVSSRRRG